MSRQSIATIAPSTGEGERHWLRRIERWLPGRRGPIAGDHRLTQRNVYIMPSRAGAAYFGVLALMLLASVNYGLALGYALTFLLGSLALVAMMHTFRNLSELALRANRAEAVFVGEFAEIDITVCNPSRMRRHAIALIAPGTIHAQFVDLEPDSEGSVRVPVRAERRGRMPSPRLMAQTRFPIGIFRAWAYWQPALSLLVYPRPEDPALPLPAQSIDGEQDGGIGGSDDDLSALRPWRSGDSPRSIAWKAMARTDSIELLVKQFDGGQSGELLLDWGALPATLDVESRLSRLTRWVIDADGAGARYALQMPGRRIGPDLGAAHREECLEALALFGYADRGS